MKTLNDRLMEKARSEFEKLYYSTIQGAVKNIVGSLKIGESVFRRDESLSKLWNMQWSPESTQIIERIFPAYAERYVEDFIQKVEEAQSMLEEHTHG